MHGAGEEERCEGGNGANVTVVALRLRCNVFFDGRSSDDPRLCCNLLSVDGEKGSLAKPPSSNLAWSVCPQGKGIPLHELVNRKKGVTDN